MRRDARVIYTLRDPLSNECRYVGQTRSPHRREDEHRRSPTWSTRAGEDPVVDWLRELKSSGVAPRFEVVETGVRYEEREAIERKWVEEFVEAGHRLFNVRLMPGAARLRDWNTAVESRVLAAIPEAGAHLSTLAASVDRCQAQVRRTLIKLMSRGLVQRPRVGFYLRADRSTGP